MKFMKIACVIAVALCLAGSVYAETQSVKVSGDLTVRGIARDHYDYLDRAGSIEDGANNTRTNQAWMMSVAEIQVDADLTDNVQTVIRLVNQRDWNVSDRDTDDDSIYPNGLGQYSNNEDAFNVMVDLAYVTLKDFIYSPLTLTIGRQDLWFGKGFIVGANMQNPGMSLNGSPNQLNGIGSNLGTTGNLSAPEYTAITGFDSVKAVLDYDPWTITGVYANIQTGAVQALDDINLWGVNVGYKFDAYKAEMEGYWFWKNDNAVHVDASLKDRTNNVQTIGLRGSFDPIDVITIAAEGAYQGGTYVGSEAQTSNDGRSAWALDVSVEGRMFTDKYSWKPKIGAEFIWYSGEAQRNDSAGASGTYNGWDPMYRGKFDSAIREFVGRFYQSGRFGSSADQLVSCPDASFTNQYQVIFLGSIQPMESLTIKANYNLFWNQEQYQMYDTKTKGFVGQEIDINTTWDYTEDVSFGLMAGIFVPGTVYDTSNQGNGMYENGGGADYEDKWTTGNQIATDIVGSVKVSF